MRPPQSDIERHCPKLALPRATIAQGQVQAAISEQRRVAAQLDSWTRSEEEGEGGEEMSEGDERKTKDVKKSAKLKAECIEEQRQQRARVRRGQERVEDENKTWHAEEQHRSEPGNTQEAKWKEERLRNQEIEQLLGQRQRELRDWEAELTMREEKIARAEEIILQREQELQDREEKAQESARELQEEASRELMWMRQKLKEVEDLAREYQEKNFEKERRIEELEAGLAAGQCSPGFGGESNRFSLAGSDRDRHEYINLDFGTVGDTHPKEFPYHPAVIAVDEPPETAQRRRSKQSNQSGIYQTHEILEVENVPMMRNLGGGVLYPPYSHRAEQKANLLEDLLSLGSCETTSGGGVRGYVDMRNLQRSQPNVPPLTEIRNEAKNSLLKKAFSEQAEQLLRVFSESERLLDEKREDPTEREYILSEQHRIIDQARKLGHQSDY